MKSVAKNNADGSESIGGGGQMIKGWTTICQAKAGGGQMIEGWTTTCQAKAPIASRKLTYGGNHCKL